MKLVFVNVMHNLYRLDMTSSISQPPVPLAILNGATPREIETDLIDEQADDIRFDGDVIAFTVSTQFAAKIYEYADELRAAGKTVILGGIHVTVRPEEAMWHADAIVTGEAEEIWPTVCADLLAGRLKKRYDGAPTPAERMVPVDYRFFGDRFYLTPASIYATRGCPHHCSFCVGGNLMGPLRKKPLDVFEQEIDQLRELYPKAFIQFTDDNLFADREYGSQVLAILRRKKLRYLAMITLAQFSDDDLMQEMADSGCLGVAVGVESVDDDNCIAVAKHHNVGLSFPEAVRRANEKGIPVGVLLIVGLPHDTPERLDRTRRYLEKVPCNLYDFRILRVYPGAPLYDDLVARDQVTDEWWLREDPIVTNRFLPGHLRVHYRHPHFTPIELQRTTLAMTTDLNRVSRATVSHVMRIGVRSRALKFAAQTLTARRRIVKLSRGLLRRVEGTMAGNGAPVA